ncbi:MAG: SAM-dependent methyltransferase, partial [Methanobrevibacter sp.]|nr:SAM-dependent methyltransferase [Methanobrevibacter sp.]
GKIIPQGITNTAELVNHERHHIHWDEDVNYEVFSKPVVYSQINFLDDINPDFKADLKLKANRAGLINGLKITTYTKLDDNIIAGPTPMLNPPLLVPLPDKQVNINDFINVEIKYIMGNGIESIETGYL